MVSQDDSNPKDTACSCLWQSILTILAPIIGIFGSLLIFYLKLKSDKEKEADELARRQREEANKKHQENENYWKYLILVLDNIVKNTKNQSNFCQIFSDKLKNENLRPAMLEFAASYSLDRFLDKTEQKELLHHFLIRMGQNQKNIELFNEIYKNLDYVKALIENIVGTNENFQGDLNNQRNNFSIQYDNFRDYLIALEAEISTNTNNSEEDKQLLQFIKTTIVEFFQSFFDSEGNPKIENDNISKLFELLPQKILNKLHTSYKNSKYHLDLFLRCKNIKVTYFRLFMTVSKQIETFKQYAISLEKVSNDLNNIKNEITAPNN